ncbi:MAG TPA: hypothetical protein VJ997_10245, partial [Longimicrobiales bacterium]|nr:hypothetical protein [Longimicrobiales bacterium]
MRRRDFLTTLAAAALVPEVVRAELWRALPRVAPVRSGALHALILGSVQDAGLPQVGCYTELCDLGRELHAQGRG